MATGRLRNYVKRYTKLKHAVTALQNKKLSLPKPSSWDDLNDQEFVKLYRRYVSAKSVYAMCCTMSAERYHHWRVFTEKDPTGVCIEFKRAPLQVALNHIQYVRAGPVDYIPLKEMRKTENFRPEDLPFIKRVGYSDEREWRILVTSPKQQGALFELPFSLDWVHRIILNPWMTERDREAARRALRPLIKKEVRIKASFLTNSAEWKKLGKAVVR